MNKIEMINAVYNKVDGIHRDDVSEVINAAIDVVSDTIVSGGAITVSNFGTLKSVERAARTGRNPMTGEAIDIPEKKSVVFKASKSFKDMMNA